MQFEAEVQLQHLLTAKNTKVQIFAARFAQLHHRHQAGPDHPEIAPGGPDIGYKERKNIILA